jgi:hypothetical protein
MGCVNDHPVYLYTMAACFNFLPWILVNLEPRNALLSVFIAINIGIIGSGFITANIAGINMNNIASSLPILFAISFVMWSAIQLFATVAAVFALMGIMGSAVIINKKQVHDLVNASIGVDIGDAGFYAIIGSVLLLMFFGYYAASSSYWLSILIQTLVYSALATISIHWLWEAVRNDYVVCCNQADLTTCPVYLWWWWLVILLLVIALRCVLVFWYHEYQRNQAYKQYKKIESPRVRYAGVNADGAQVRLLY